mgnify:CR=1 FL=1
MSTYYFPEGAFGPICDLPQTDEDLSYFSRAAVIVEDDDTEIVYGNPTDWYLSLDGFFGEKGRWYLNTKCKKRILDDGTIEYYDCEDQFSIPPVELPLPPEYEAEVANLGLNEKFFVPKMDPDACSPFRPDINIRSLKFYTPNGTLVEKTPIEGSSPVTFPVTSETQSIPNNATITATFDANSQNLIIGGTGSGIVQISLEWDDRTNIAGVAVDNIQIGSTTWTQSGRSGQESHSLELAVGSYPITYNGLNAANNPIIQNGNTSLCLKDGDGSDCNATFTIQDVLPTTTTTNVQGYWSEEGNKYGVWTNPAVCTLPFIPQIVTYKIPIAEADTYGFTFACDDNATLTIGDSTTPLLDITGGIFAGGSYNTPYTATASLNAGTLLLTVNCTNSDAGFSDAEGKPTGLAYSWQRNPGGWYIKICKGGVCTSGTNIAWVTSGPHPLWSSFMNTYAVFPSNQDPLLDSAQTATWNINIPTTGNYEFECQADNTATFSLDGTQIATSGSFTSSTTTTLTNLSEGGHTLTVSVTNVTSSGAANTWTDNPGGAAWTIKYNSNIDANFNSNGDLVVTGAGFSDLSFAFAWSDNPSTYDTALGTYALPQLGISFTQNTSTSSGSNSGTATGVSAGTYTATILNNSGGFTVQNGGKKLCFKDLDGNDCNAEVVVTVGQTNGIIASSLDLNTLGDGNLFWHTREATGYKYITS